MATSAPIAGPDGVSPSGAAQRPAPASPDRAARGLRPAPPRERPARWAGVAAALVLCVLALAGVAYVLSPATVDQGAIANVAHVWLRGGVPYRDTWDPKGPAAALSFLAVEVIFGRSELGVRAVDLLLLAGASVLFGAGAARALGRGVGWTAGLLYPVVVLQLGGTDLAQPDGWIAYAVAATMPWIVAADMRRHPARLALAGFAACVVYASLVKPFFPVLAVLPAGSALVFGLGWRAAARRVTLCALAVLAGAGFTVAYFAAVGAVDRFVEVYLWYSSAVYAHLAPPGRAAHTVQQLGMFFFARNAVRAQLACALAGVVSLRRTHPRLLALLVGWEAFALALVALQHKYYGYHYHLAFAPLALLTSVGAVRCGEAIREAWRARPRRRGGALSEAAPAAPRHLPTLEAALALVVLVMLVVPLVGKLARNGAGFAAAVVAAPSRPGPLLDRLTQGDQTSEALAHRRLARRLQASGRPCTVASWSYASTYAWLADCRFASRFIFNGPLVYAPGSDVNRRYRAEFLASFHEPRRAPTWVVVDTAYGSWAGPEADWNRFPEFRAIVDSAYRPVPGEGTLLVFERRAP